MRRFCFNRCFKGCFSTRIEIGKISVLTRIVLAIAESKELNEIGTHGRG